MSKPRVLVTDGINEAAVSILQETCEVDFRPKLSAEELLDAIGQAEGLMVRSASQVTAAVLARAPQLKIVGRAGVGVDNIDLAAANEHGVLVVNSPEGNTIAAAEHTLGLLFALARHIPQGDATLKAGQWERKKLTGVELLGKTLGLVGLGKIGSHVAKVCVAIGMTVIVYDPFISEDVTRKLGVELVPLADIWKRSDFITVHVPKTKDTLNLLNKDTLALCKPGVRLVNCARGGIINEADLAEALKSGQVAGAALDVFSTEPPPPDLELLKLNGRVIVTPHLGASTEEAQVNVALDVAQQLREFFQTGNAKSAVNMPLLRADILDPVRPYMPLAETLGKVARQLIQGPVHQVRVEAKGSLAKENTAPLALAALKGMLSLSREGVNLVNARYIAQQRGIDIVESRAEHAGSYANLLDVTLVTAEGEARVAGTVVGRNLFRITRLNAFRTQLELQPPHVLLVPHVDKPGMVAQVASILGQSRINISAMQVGNDPSQGRSVMVFNLDSPAPEAVLQAISAIDGCHSAHSLTLA